MNVIKSELIAAKRTFESLSLNAIKKQDRERTKAKVEVFEWLLFQFDFEELEAKAAKWDAVQWAIDNKVYFTGMGVAPIFKIDMDRLERLYKEREQDGR